MSDASDQYVKQTEKAKEEAREEAERLRDIGEEDVAESMETLVDKNPQAFTKPNINETFYMYVNDEENKGKVDMAVENVKNRLLFNDKANDFEVFADYKDDNGDFKPNILAKEIETEYEFLYSEFEETLYVYKDGYYQDDGERTVKEEVNKRLDNQLKTHYMSEVLNAIQTRPGITVDHREFVPPKFKINFENGVYDLETGEFEEHSSEYYFTQQVPWEYDPETEPEEIDDFFGDITRTEDDKESLYELSGYAMMTSMPISNAFMLAGQGSNGKTVFLNSLEKMIGYENTKHEDLQQIEDSRFATQSIHQKLMVVSDDLPSKELEEGNTLKALTGGGTIRAEYKGGDHFEFDNYALPVFAANEIPPTKDQSPGFFRRWTIIDFPYTFTEDPEGDMEKQKEPEFKLMRRINSDEEMKGYVSKSVEALQEVFDQGYFTHKSSPEETRMKWNSYADPVMEFIQKYVEQGISQNEAERRDPSDAEGLQNYDDKTEPDLIMKDDLHSIVSMYAESKNHRAPTKADLTRRLNQDTEMFFSNTRVRTATSDDGLDPVYRGLRWGEDLKELCRESSDEEEVWNRLDLKSVNGALPTSIKQFIGESTDTDDTENSDSSDHSDLEKNVLNLVDSMEDAGEQDVIDLTASLEDVSKDKVENVLENLENNGQVYSPSPGVVEVM